MASMHRTLTIRDAKGANEALRELSELRGASMNNIDEQGILIAAQSARKERLQEAFARIAASSNEDQSVEFAFEAQREVVFGGS